MNPKLLELVPPPPDRTIETRDWERVEERFGLRIPDDYRDFLEIYGPGTWALEYRILDPFCPSPYQNFDHAFDLIDTYDHVAELYPDGGMRPRFPAEGSFFPFASGWSGCSLIWEIGKDRAVGRAGIQTREGEEIWTDLSATELLLRLLVGPQIPNWYAIEPEALEAGYEVFVDEE